MLQLTNMESVLFHRKYRSLFQIDQKRGNIKREQHKLATILTTHAFKELTL